MYSMWTQSWEPLGKIHTEIFFNLVLRKEKTPVSLWERRKIAPVPGILVGPESGLFYQVELVVNKVVRG